jgi:hypothetical protein
VRKLHESGWTGLPATLENEAAEQGHGDFAAWFAKFEAFARPKTPVLQALHSVHLAMARQCQMYQSYGAFSTGH